MKRESSGGGLMRVPFQIPFSLCLRVWDIFLLEGERVVTAMAYTILKLHATRLLKFKDMDAITDFLQVSLDGKIPVNCRQAVANSASTPAPA
jgi:hypothetical protein